MTAMKGNLTLVVISDTGVEKDGQHAELGASAVIGFGKPPFR